MSEPDTHAILDLTRNLRTENGVLDVRPIKATVGALPDFVLATEEAEKELDTISAMFFHTLFALRLAVSAERWSKNLGLSPEPSKANTASLLGDIVAELMSEETK